MDPDTEIELEIEVELSPIIRIYKSGRVERLLGNTLIPSGVDPLTGVTSRDVVINATTNLSARLYLPDPNTMNNNKKKLPILVYFHGGGFCVDSPFSSTYHPYLNLLTSKASVLAVSVNYRLAPEHPLPAAYTDSLAALRWVAVAVASGDAWVSEYGDLDKVFLAGDSAGGNIAYNVARMAAGDNGLKLAGMALVHPHFWGKVAVRGEVRDPVEARLMEKVWRLACPDSEEGDDDPWINPLVLEELSLGWCRRVAVFVAEEDGLMPRGVALYEKLRGSTSKWGGEVELVVTEGEGHDFHIRNPECDKAMEKMSKFAAFLNA